MLRSDSKEWLTVKEVSNITGKSVEAVRMLLHRNRLSNVKKVNTGNAGRHRAQWLIHRDTVKMLHNSDVTSSQQTVMHNSNITEINNCNVIPLEYHDAKMKEWLQERDQLQTGLMMYRYRFEELDRQVKLLPAPVEAVSAIMQEKEAQLSSLGAELQATRKSLENERSRNWWQKLWGK